MKKFKAIWKSMRKMGYDPKIHKAMYKELKRKLS
jgi:hypothetical protein